MESEWAVINAAIVDTQVLLLMAVETDEKKKCCTGKSDVLPVRDKALGMGVNKLAGQTASTLIA